MTSDDLLSKYIINRVLRKAIFAETTGALIAADKSIPRSLPQYSELINHHVRVSY